MTKLIALDTYKKGKLGRMGFGALPGEHKTVKVGLDWLKREIAPQTIDDFLSEYTFDDSEHLYNQYQLDKTGSRKKVNDFLDELRKLSAKHGVWIEKVDADTYLFDDNLHALATEPTFNSDKQLYEARFPEDTP